MTLFTAHFKILRLLPVIIAAMTISMTSYGQSVVIKGPDDGRRGVSTRTPIKGPLSQQTPSRHGPITNADTLWNIAKTYRPNPAINMTQMMVALQRYNPDAFENGNLNAMVNGQYIVIPSENYIASINLTAARQKFAQDNKDWQGKKTKTSVKAVKSVTTTSPKVVVQQPSSTANTPLVDSPVKTTAVQAEQSNSPRQAIKNDADITKLQKQFGASISNMQSLLDQNKALYSRLDTVNDELVLLRSQLNDMKSLEGQVSDLKAQQKKLAELPPVFSDAPDNSISDESSVAGSYSPYLWLLLSIVPTLLIIGGGAYFLFRGKKPTAKVAAPADENLMDLADEEEDIAQQLADQMASDDLFGDDDLLDELQDSELTDFDDFNDELLVEESVEEEQVSLLSLGDDELLSDEAPATDAVDADNDNLLDELSLDTEVSQQQGAEDNLEMAQDESFTLLDQDGLDALFEDDSNDTETVDSAMGDSVEPNNDNNNDDVEITADELGDTSPEDLQPAPESQLPMATSSAIDGDLTDASTERLIQLDSEADELVSDTLVESIVSEINTKADQFEKLSAQVLDEIEQVEQLEQMLGSSMLDLSDDIDFDSPAAEQSEGNKSSSYEEQQDELPLDYEDNVDVNVEDEDELSQALAEFDADTADNIDNSGNLAAQETESTTEPSADQQAHDHPDEDTEAEQPVQSNETSATPSSQREHNTDSPSMSTSFAMSMDAASDGYSTMQTIESGEVRASNQDADSAADEQTEVAPEPSPEPSAEADESDLLDELEQTNFEELLDSLAVEESGAADSEPELHGDPSQLLTSDNSNLERPDLDLDALLDNSQDASDPIPMSQPAMAETAAVQDFVDVDELLTEDGEEEFVEKPFNFDAVLPPLSESNEVQGDDKGLGGKLDLALAYIEIEDVKAAKTLLDDVIQRGTAIQRSEAQTILAKLA